MRSRILLSLLVLLSACASIGLSPAKSFDQKLAYAYGTHTAVLQAATAGVIAKSLTKTDGEQVLNLADEARTLLDAAKTIAATGQTGAAYNKLLLATAILEQLQTYLNSRASK